MTDTLNQAAIVAIEAALASMRDLAVDVGVNQSTVARWKLGRTSIGPATALRLAEVLKGRATRLLGAVAALEAIARLEMK